MSTDKMQRAALELDQNDTVSRDFRRLLSEGSTELSLEAYYDIHEEPLLGWRRHLDNNGAHNSRWETKSEPPFANLTFEGYLIVGGDTSTKKSVKYSYSLVLFCCMSDFHQGKEILSALRTVSDDGRVAFPRVSVQLETNKDLISDLPPEVRTIDLNRSLTEDDGRQIWWHDADVRGLLVKGMKIGDSGKILEPVSNEGKEEAWLRLEMEGY